MTSPVIISRSHLNLRTVSQYCIAYRSYIGYFIGGLAASFAFVGICLMSGDSRIRQQQLKIAQYQNDDYMADLSGLRLRHDNITRSLSARPSPCKEKVRDLRKLHAEMETLLRLALPSIILAGSQWARQHYFEDHVAQPLMSLFLVCTAAGVTCLLIALVSSVDNVSAAARRSYFQVPRKPPEAAKSFPTPVDPANPQPERIPRCYKLKELESDLESITRLELDDNEGGNHYVYGPWRVYCESRDGSIPK